VPLSAADQQGARRGGARSLELITLFRFIRERWGNSALNGLAAEAETTQILDSNTGNQWGKLPANPPSY
jgi:hypothetical protein